MFNKKYLIRNKERNTCAAVSVDSRRTRLIHSLSGVWFLISIATELMSLKMTWAEFWLVRIAVTEGEALMDRRP